MSNIKPIEDLDLTTLEQGSKQLYDAVRLCKIATNLTTQEKLVLVFFKEELADQVKELAVIQWKDSKAWFDDQALAYNNWHTMLHQLDPESHWQVSNMSNN